MNEEYDKNAWYKFTDKNGETHYSRGDNGYIWQAYTEGIPISVNDKGEWYTEPYLEVTPTGYVSHIPSWFKQSKEYEEWLNTYVPQLEAASPTVENFNNAQEVLKSLGNQGRLRFNIYNQAEDVGITDPDIKNYVYTQYLDALSEGVNKKPANLLSYSPDWSTSKEIGNSAAEFARSMQKMSKEDLSKKLLEWEHILKKDNIVDTQEEKGLVLAAYKILNLIADSPADFGDGKEFEGLLEASEWQKFQTHINNVVQTISENLPLVTFGARLGSGLGSMAGGKSFADGWQIEKRREQQYGYLRSEATGGGLRGTEGSAVSGTWAGAIISMAGTMVEAAASGNWFGSTAIGSSLGAVMKGGGSFLSKLGGGMMFDFFFNDIPVDFSLFATDLAATGSLQEAWESQTGQTQPLFGLFGPEVPAGLKYNLIGDAVLDLTLPVAGIANKALWSKLDTVTGGSVSKIRETVGIKNLAIQQGISDTPVIGTGLQKFSNWLFGAENASFIREKRKEAIIKGSMTPYTDAQNLLTLKNHYGAEVVAPMYKALSDELGINDQVKYFNNNAKSYGGIGETKIEWDGAEGGVKKHLYETVKDDLPRKVKSGLLDYQRLEELKGERMLEGEDLISNPKRDKEIATLEKRVAELPDKIKKFAENFSELNKRVESMAVSLGLSTQDWIDSLMEDPRWKNYMTRQVLVPGGIRNAGKLDPSVNKLLTGKRTGYYNPDKTLSPLMTLDMKVHAMGNAYAWNERAKALVAAEMVQGKITAGGNSVELAQKIKEKRAQLAEQEAIKNQIGFDGIVNGYNERMMGLSATVNKINEKINSLENTTVKSVYTSTSNPEIEGHINDFNAGKITFADGIREEAGLSIQEGNTVIGNTYKLGIDTKSDTQKIETPKTDVPKVEPPKVETPKVEAPKVEPQKITTPLLGQEKPQPFKQEMWHGSGKPASEIYVGAPVPVLGEGKYWAFDETKAKNFGDNIETETITLERPLIIRSDEDWRTLTKQAGWQYPNPIGTEKAQLIADTRLLKKMVTDAGYDGIIIYVGKSQDGLLRDVFSIDQVVSYKPKNDIDITSASEAVPKENYYAGVTADGVPYRYTINNGKITSMEKVTDTEGLVEALNGVNKNFYVSTNTAEKMGAENMAGATRAAMFFRDNFPNIGVEGSFFVTKTKSEGAYGEVLANPYISVQDGGKIKISFESKLSDEYYVKGNEKKLLTALENDTKEETRSMPGRNKEYTGTWHPKNSVDLSHCPIHEATHTLMLQLAMLEENLKIEGGITGYLIGSSYAQDINRDKFYRAKCAVEEDILKAAAARIGGTLNDDLRAKISLYAIYPYELSGRNAETITEAMVDYAFNGSNANEFSVAIVQEISSRLQKHSMAVSPSGTMKENGLKTPKGLLDGDQYAFPDNVKTQAQKAEWLNQWRKKNPYLKGEFDEEAFRKANLWDSYFQKEIRAFDPNCRTEAPEALLKKSGEFIEQTQKESAQTIISEIKKLSGEDFDEDLAMLIVGRNGNDIAAAMDNYILRQVENSAKELAKNMEGGATAENLNIARVTLWADESVKNSTKEMLMSLVPDGGDVVSSRVDILFDEQAKGLAAYDKLPVDSKALMDEKAALVDALYKENSKTLKKGKVLDKNSSFRDGASHVIHYKEGGEDVYVTVDDPVIASILQKPYDYKENGLLSESLESMANFLATTYRLGTTGLNPMALIRNVLRDPIQAMVTAGFSPLSMSLSPELFYKTLRQYGLDDDTIAEVGKRIRNWAQTGTMTEEMRIGPGKNARTYKNNVEKVSNKLNDVTNGKVIRTLQAPLETWEGFFRNQVGQQSFVKNFRRTGDVDKALSSALFDTSNATTNFSHAIGKWRWATSTVPYLSSAINGTVSFWRLFNIDPLGMTARITAGFMLPVMAITMWNLSSEENRRAYETLPEWFRQGHLVMADGEGNIIAFPLPEEIQNFAGTARKLIEFTQEVSPFSVATIAAQGAFGFLPFEVDGFWGDDGSFQLKEGAFQMVSGLIPQAATTLYEFIWEHDLFTGEDLSTYNGLNKTINTLSNIFGTGIKQVFNSIGIMFGAKEKDLVGKSFQDTIARDLFGMGFDAAKNQFMAIVGSPAKLLEDGSMSKATGLFQKNEELKKKIDALSTKIAVASDEEKPGLEEQKKKMVDDFTKEVANAMNNYQRLFSLTGGLEAWQKERLVQLLTLGDAWSSGDTSSYQAGESSTSFLSERGLAQQRYVEAGLPAGPDEKNLVGNNSIELQAAINRFYGVAKQATQDYKNAIEESGIKDIRDEFYSAISKIYDSAEEQEKQPDYDLIEKIQARYLQSIDSVLMPIINRYGINILNNNDFIDAVRRQVNGMIPSDDWRQSAKNARRFLSTKEFPTATVDVKKWLKNRYSSGMRDRGIDSDPEVIERINSIRADIDVGRMGVAKGKIDDLKKGISKSNFYISAKDLMTLNDLNNMVK